MGVTHRRRQGVRRVVWSGDFFQLQQASGHLHDLTFFRPAIAGYRLLDLGRRIFKKRNISLRQRQQDHASGMAHRDAGGHIGVEKKFLHAGGLRLRRDPE